MKDLGALERVTAGVVIFYLVLLIVNPCVDSRLYHLLEFAQELLALAMLVLLFEHYKEKKAEREKSASVKHAIAWLIDPNALQLDAKEWLSKARSSDGVPNQPMPFSEIKAFYYRILLLGVDMPDFVEFGREMKSLKEALHVSNEWDQFRAIRPGSVIKFSQQLEPLLKKVGLAAEKMKATWTEYALSIIAGETKSHDQ